MSVDRRLTAFFDAAVEQYLLSTSDRVLGELTVRRAGLSGETAMPIAVAVALLARARDDGHSALSLSDLAAEATELAQELATAVGADASGALMHERDPAWWRAMLIAVPSVVQGANSSAASPLVLHGSLVQFRRYFDAEQRIAAHLRMSLTHGEPTFRVITGGPGTGKTTTVMRLLALLQAAHGPSPLRVLLAAPTGKAAARLNASMAQAHAALPADWQTALPAEAQTLHKMLGWHGLATPLTGQRQLYEDVMVVDEASMIDLEMMARLLQAVPTPARLVLLGDKDQLASVEAGAVMAQLCQSPLLHGATATLTHSHRFGHDSAIGQWAQAVNTGDRARLQALWQQASTDSDPQAVGVSRWQAGANQHAMWGTAQVARVRAGWSEWLQRIHPAPNPGPWPEPTAFSDAQARLCLNDFSRLGVLCALREGPWGVHAFNLGLARSLGLPGSGWYSGRPVVVTRNDSALGLMNGDVGLCLPRAVNGQTALQVAFADGADGVRWVAPTRLEHVDTALAMTVHQSQGSEFDAVLLVLPERDAPVLSRELIYTGITRARHSLGIWAPEPQVWWNACARVTQRSGGLRE